MKLRISNLGVIDTMEIDMAKPFILFAGDNGTGKTYVSTFLYCLIINLLVYLYKDYFTEEKRKLPVSRQLKSGWDGVLDPDELYTIFEKYLAKNKSSIIESMNLNVDEKAFKCSIVTSREQWREELTVEPSYVESGKSSFSKENNTLRYSIRHSEKSLVEFTEAVALMALYFHGVIGTNFMTAERNGIYTFSKELSLGRLRNPELMARNRYPQPIAFGLADAEDLANRRKQISPHRGLADEIERDIAHGKLSITDEGEVKYSVDEETTLGINESSSAIKTLAPIVFYLRHFAGKNSILFIDEPELNLHPKNQILVARVFGKMINAGLRLVVSTHSDYIIREINNMIMADALTKAGSDLPGQQGYDASLCLAAEKFAPYLFEAGSGKRGKVAVRPLEVDRYGFAMPSIDEAINRQNEVTDTLYEVLKYDYPNK